MFREHQPIVAAHARSDAEAFAEVLQFVILTIRETLANVPANTEIAREGGDEAMGVLFGVKFQAYTEAWRDRETHYTFCEHSAAHHDGDDLARVLIEYIAGLPGFGPVKAGFVAQLIYGVGGCLDTHNLRRFGLSPTAFNGYKQLKTAKGRRRKVAAYVEACNKFGGAEALWNTWCIYVAERQPGTYRDADSVSRVHVEALSLSV